MLNHIYYELCVVVIVSKYLRQYLFNVLTYVVRTRVMYPGLLIF